MADCEIIQKDLDQIIQWVGKVTTSSSLDKCKFMSFGPRNSNHTKNMRGEPLKVVQEETDFSTDSKRTKHIAGIKVVFV